MIKKTLMLIFLSGVICLPVLRAGNEVKKSKFESRRYNNHSIVVRQTRPHVDHIGGRLPSEDVVKRAAERFFAVLDQLPANFIKRSGLKYVTFQLLYSKTQHQTNRHIRFYLAKFSAL